MDLFMSGERSPGRTAAGAAHWSSGCPTTTSTPRTTPPCWRGSGAGWAAGAWSSPCGTGPGGEPLVWDGPGGEPLVWDGPGGEPLVWDGPGGEPLVWNGLGGEPLVCAGHASASQLPLCSVIDRWV
ncbi:hypothetical protein AAFF_G00190770 [Aldrovandia affinis]|uniref:Uncharacterized protein n=1 Tax=Aldrovandia affinis TaxID=143900 RepID=A0AAD7W6L5_9TELE|nr:hypothetical protein AAFF_G00190770 [Aldrovandia affinis]